MFSMEKFKEGDQGEGRYDVITGGSSHLFISSMEKIVGHISVIHGNNKSRRPGESRLDVNNRTATFMSYMEKIRGGG
jgi:hypothetical protein